MEVPEIRYARTVDELHIAYQVVGHGSVDLVFVPPWISVLDLQWEDEAFARFLRRLTAFGRLIVFDKRGTGLSDRVSNELSPDLETRMDDVRAVMDSAGSDRAAILGLLDGGHLAALFAATNPERTSALILWGSSARGAWAPDYPWGMTLEGFEEQNRQIEAGWGTTDFVRWVISRDQPSSVGDEAYVRWLARCFRHGASPGAALALNRMWFDTDVRSILPMIRVPTLVLNRKEAAIRGKPAHLAAEESRVLAGSIPGARLVELPGSDFWPWLGDSESAVAEIQEFVTGSRAELEPDRVLATVLFTDIVGSTRKASELGDRRWRELLTDHRELVRAELDRFRGREMGTAGDGFLATFDGPARAVRCAMAIRGPLEDIGIRIRAGVHTGEVELMGDDIGGIAVHIGARVAAMAGPGEVLVSSTVKDLVAGSGLEFEDRGEHELKGVPDLWHLYRVVDA